MRNDLCPLEILSSFKHFISRASQSRDFMLWSDTKFWFSKWTIEISKQFWFFSHRLRWIVPILIMLLGFEHESQESRGANWYSRLTRKLGSTFLLDLLRSHIFSHLKQEMDTKAILTLSSLMRTNKRVSLVHKNMKTEDFFLRNRSLIKGLKGTLAFTR